MSTKYEATHCAAFSILYIKPLQIKINVGLNSNNIVQGCSNCGKRTTSGTPDTVQWYTSLVRKI
jgi:hypothetical protein